MTAANPGSRQHEHKAPEKFCEMQLKQDTCPAKRQKPYFSAARLKPPQLRLTVRRLTARRHEGQRIEAKTVCLIAVLRLAGQSRPTVLNGGRYRAAKHVPVDDRTIV